MLLAATASTASAAPVVYQWECPVPSTPPTTLEQIPGCLGGFAGPGRTFDFGDRQVGTTSLPQRFALGVSSDTFTPGISVSGDYAQTNNCPPTLSAPEGQIQGCLIAVTFAPTDTGRKEGTLSTGRGGPTVALTGNGVKHRTAPGPLKLETRVEQPSTRKMRKVRISATSNYDSKVVASGDVKRTTKQLKGGKEAVIETKLKRPGRLLRSPEACLPARFCHRGAKIKVRATDEFGQTDTEFHRYYQR